MNLNKYLSEGVQSMVETVGKFYLSFPRGLAFVARQAKSIAAASRRRSAHEREGLHVPVFLIASIASECNLNCEGCYARQNGTIGPEAKSRELSCDAWEQIFDEAQALGSSFMLLAGGEPTLRRDVIERAAACRDIVFPVFTNGLLIDESYLDLFDKHRNLILVFSIEGDGMRTDARRGPGVAQAIRPKMAACKKRRILWGASITVTTQNLEQVTNPEYVNDLHALGCGLIVYVEYVPVDPTTRDLALDLEQQRGMLATIEKLRADPANKGTIMVAFPGSEERMGGCLAAGRGFFHIAQDGSAEPCPFSPYSVANVAEVGLEGALRSPFFERVRKIEANHSLEHEGGCALFAHADEVRAAL